MSDSTVSLPSLLILAGLSFFIYRVFFGGSSTGGGRGHAGSPRRIDPAAIEQVAGMFPQLDRRAIAWDLQRNGGNAQATVERMLTTGRLDAPPPSFQPPGLQPAAGANNGAAGSRGTTTSSSSGRGASSKRHPDLITRYNLSTRLDEDEDEEEGKSRAEKQAEQEAASKGKAKAAGWSSNKDERAAMVQRRKEQMILQARRKMEQKDRREEKGKAVERS